MTKLISVIKMPKRNAYQAEVEFVRRDEQGREYIIYACRCYESWEQWGAPTKILSENVEAVEIWRSQGVHQAKQLQEA